MTEGELTNNKEEDEADFDELGEKSLEPGNYNSEDSEEDNTYTNSEIKVERGQFSIFEMKRKRDKKQLILDPDFQRLGVWKPKQRSELIESVIMGIPLPLIYLAENEDGTLVVVDGRQRLSALFDFLDNKYQLTGLNIIKDLNRRNFANIDTKYQSKLEDYQIIFHKIQPPTGERVKFDIFDRVNRGGTRLNNQEMRNSLYQGKSTKFIKDLANSSHFKKATNESLSDKRMKDRYAILRYLSFYMWKSEKKRSESKIEYKSDIDDFLARNMKFLNIANDIFLSDLEKNFNTAMKKAFYIFEGNAFRINYSSNKKSPINMALFESLGYFLTKLEIEINEQNKKIITEKLKNYIHQDEEFKSSITYTIDSNKSVSKRFEKMDLLLKEIMLLEEQK